ncbi:MAG: tetratricopeptide repeat protein [Altibacter sp.]|nr:tetratricopeptide repeat protein [Altibacter sp.]
MKLFNTPFAFVMVITLVLMSSCKQPEEPKVVFPENDIPVGATTDEALEAFMKGLQLYDEGDIVNARPHFKKAVALDPDFVSGHMYVAFTSSSNKEWAENRDAFLAMRDKGSEADLLNMDLLEAGMADDSDKELEIVTTMVTKYPKSARALDYLAGYYSGRDNEPKARDLWKQAIELDSSYTPAVSILGNSYLFISPKDFEEAQRYMQMWVHKLPQSSQARIGLGDTYRAQNNLEMALENYEMAAKLDPKNEVAHSKAGHANTFMGHYDLARQNFRDARAVSEFGTGSYNFEAYTYLYEGDHKKALAFLEEGAKMFDSMDIPESNKNGVKMGCVSDCAMIAMHYGDGKHLKELVAMMKPMSEQISREVNSPITTKYQTASMHYWDAIVSATQGEYKEALLKADAIKEILKDVDNPNRFRLYHRVHAVVNYEQGNYEKALEHLAKLNEDNVYVQYMMARTYKMMGDEAKAMELFNEVAHNNFNSVAYALVRNETKELIASAN